MDGRRGSIEQPLFPPGPPRSIRTLLVYGPGRDPLSFFGNLARTYGDFAHIHMAGEHVFLVTDPRAIRDILVTDQRLFMKGRGLDRAKRLLGDGLLTSGGAADLQVRDEAMTIFLAGHETTANALAWTWHLLSQAPEVEAKLHEEVDRVLGGRLPTVDDIPSLSYTEKVVTESMRLYPPAWIIGRRALADHAIGEYLIPARSIVVMSPYLVHRDARHFSDPERFLPDRWSAEFKARLQPFAYFPFGGGARRCIGESFAWMELVLVVSTIAQQWRLRLVPGHPVVPQPVVTLRVS